MNDAKPKRGGARPGAGRPKKQPQPISATGEDPKTFLLAVMQDVNADQRVRLDAARSLLPYTHAKLGEGKKQAQAKAAQTASSGKFAAAAPPKLRVVRPNETE